MVNFTSPATPVEPPRNPIVTFLSTKTGISTALLTTAVTIAAPIISHVWTHKTAYEAGKADYQEAVREGTAELDGKIISILDQSQVDADIKAAKLQGEVDGYQSAQDEFNDRLERNDDRHAKTIAALAGRKYTPAETNWRAVAVPVDIGLRVDQAISARQGGDDKRGVSSSGSERVLAGGAPSDLYTPDPNKWRSER